ncbi:acyl-CoA dehydrogenase family protein [Lampropedia puyangensis]|nr:acyl-CoA dehydrogenase family protein [Lampropedia puyangensis]
MALHTADNEQADTLALLGDTAHAFLVQEQRKDRLRSIDTGRAALDANFWRQLAAQGWLLLRWPEAQGGSGLGVEAACAIAEQLGRHLVPEPVVANAMMPAVFAQLFERHANAAIWQTLANGYADGSATLALAWQPPPVGQAPMQATRSAQGFVLQGSVGGMVALALAQQLMLVAQLDAEPALFLLNTAAITPNLQTQTTSDGSTLSVLNLAGFVAPAHALLAHGPAVQHATAQARQEGCLMTAAQLLGNGEAALELTLAYLRTREQFGRPIGSFQAMQHAAVDVRIQLNLARASLQAALAKQALGESDQAQAAMTAAAKARAGDAAIQAGRFGVQAHGAMGFTAECDIGLYLKAALRLNAFLGNAREQRSHYVACMGLTEPLAPDATAHEVST